ncbi:MFS general substrate transporter [Gymnopus androsaceus JB14]|uniref:MFS general substrate transporter n=1 Tax=Gymnopus androsaceus JB14 TaxID=1447944 RepID=A0A6A4HWX4_9AGAR|nr:MFS general substrate transporter [Gymnopus androsaceus JB14]
MAFTFGHLHAPTRQYRNAFGTPVYATAASEKRNSSSVTTVVEFDESSEAHPRRWSPAYKCFVEFCVIAIAWQVNYAAAISSVTTESMSERFGVSTEVAQLSTALVFVGIALGAVPVAPLSETYGRHPVYVSTLLIASVFQFGVAAAENWSTVLACRFFAGLFGSAPLAVAGGSLFDMFTPVPVGYAFTVFSGMAFPVAMVAPVIGSWVSMLSDWRYNYYISGTTGCVLALFLALFCPETLAVSIASKRAFYMGKGDQADGVRKPTLMETLDKVLFKPLKLLFFEPLLQFLTLYLSLAYFLFFGWLEAYPVIFGTIHGLNLGQIGLTFIPICIGMILGMLTLLLFNRRYGEILAKKGSVQPEERLLPVLLGGTFVPISIFWLGWTSFESISIWSPILSGLPFGYGFIMIFTGVSQMLIDSYKHNAASAFAGNTLVRYLVSAGAIMAARPMFLNMKPQWACTLLGCVSLSLLPVAVFFYIKGPSIRRRSRYAPSDGLEGTESLVMTKA